MRLEGLGQLINLPHARLEPATLRLERLGQLKKSTSFATRAGDLAACNTVP
jgi:hypothetical protein